MSRVKKISKKQFIGNCINKQFEIIGVDETIEHLLEDKSNQNINGREWWEYYKYSTPKQYLEWKKYFFDHFIDCFPKYLSTKKRIEHEFAWFSLNYCLAFDFDPKELRELENKK